MASGTPSGLLLIIAGAWLLLQTLVGDLPKRIANLNTNASDTPLGTQQPGQSTPSSAGSGKVATPPASTVQNATPPDQSPSATPGWWARPPAGSTISGATATSPSGEVWYRAGGLPGGVGQGRTGWYNAGGA